MDETKMMRPLAANDSEFAESSEASQPNANGETNRTVSRSSDIGKKLAKNMPLIGLWVSFLAIAIVSVTSMVSFMSIGISVSNYALLIEMNVFSLIASLMSAFGTTNITVISELIILLIPSFLSAIVAMLAIIAGATQLLSKSDKKSARMNFFAIINLFIQLAVYVFLSSSFNSIGASSGSIFISGGLSGGAGMIIGIIVSGVLLAALAILKCIAVSGREHDGRNAVSLECSKDRFNRSHRSRGTAYAAAGLIFYVIMLSTLSGTGMLFLIAMLSQPIMLSANEIAGAFLIALASLLLLYLVFVTIACIRYGSKLLNNNKQASIKPSAFFINLIFQLLILVAGSVFAALSEQVMLMFFIYLGQLIVMSSLSLIAFFAGIACKRQSKLQL